MRTDENATRPPGGKPRKRIARAVALLALATLAAVGTALLLTRYMDARTAAARVPTVKVVAAAADIPVATAIKAEWLTVVDWPASSRPEGAAQEPSVVADRIAIVPIGKGEPVLAAKLAQPGARGGLATLVPDGLRAVAVRVDDVVGVAGFIHPGDRVDVIVTMQAKADAPPVSKVILQDIKVLAVGKDVEHRGKESEKAVPATVATLMVTPDESEALALGATRGKLLLALRGISDEAVAETPGMSPPVLLAAAAGEPAHAAPPVSKPARRVVRRASPNAAPAPAPPAEKKVVEILRGDLFERRDFAKAEGK